MHWLTGYSMNTGQDDPQTEPEKLQASVGGFRDPTKVSSLDAATSASFGSTSVQSADQPAPQPVSAPQPVAFDESKPVEQRRTVVVDAPMQTSPIQPRRTTPTPSLIGRATDLLRSPLVKYALIAALTYWMWARARR